MLRRFEKNYRVSVFNLNKISQIDIHKYLLTTYLRHYSQWEKFTLMLRGKKNTLSLSKAKTAKL